MIPKRQLKIVCTTASLFAIIFLIVFNFKDSDSPHGPDSGDKATFDFAGRANNDPQLIEYIKTQLYPPSNLPYNLTDPQRTDFSQYNQTEGLKKLFKTKKSGFFVEVGGYDGETFSNSLYWERELGWRGLLIEPDPKNMKILLSKNRKSYALQGCLSPTKFASTTQFISKGYLGELASGGTKGFNVSCYPLDSILAALGNPTIDFFSLDIEGWELTILKTVPFESVDIRVLSVEYNHIKEGFDALRKFMESKGYELVEVIEIDGLFRKKGVQL